MMPLVSIVTPCLNGEKFISNYFDSILNQTYKNLQLIFVDDGSTDNTKKLVEDYKKLFELNNMDFIYLYQKHGGQAKAIKLGLKYVSGKYLIWPDSDDILKPTSIEKRVQFLENNKKFGFVRSNGRYEDFNTNKYIDRISNSENRFKADIFKDLILEKTYCSCGCYMIKTEILKNIYPTFDLYESPAGQNWQMLIPYAANELCGYIDEDLYIIKVRHNSHSNMVRDEKDTINRTKELYKILENCIKIAKRYDENYSIIIEDNYKIKLFLIYYDFNDKDEIEKQVLLLKKSNLLSVELFKMYLKKFHKIKYNLYRPFWYIKKFKDKAR